MAGAADVGFPPGLNHMIGADLVLGVVVLAVGRLHKLEEFVIQAFGLEVALLFRDPFVQAEMRLDDEFRHSCAPDSVPFGNKLRPVGRAMPNCDFFRVSNQFARLSASSLKARGSLSRFPLSSSRSPNNPWPNLQSN